MTNDPKFDALAAQAKQLAGIAVEAIMQSDRLAADASRYQWLRDHCTAAQWKTVGATKPRDMDGVIDAMKEPV